MVVWTGKGNTELAAGRSANLYSSYGNQRRHPQMLKKDSPYDPVIPFLGIFQIILCDYDDTCSSLFMAVLVTAARDGNGLFISWWLDD